MRNPLFCLLPPLFLSSSLILAGNLTSKSLTLKNVHGLRMAWVDPFASTMVHEDFVADVSDPEVVPTVLPEMSTPMRLVPNGRGYFRGGVQVTYIDGSPADGVPVRFEVKAVNNVDPARHLPTLASQYPSSTRNKFLQRVAAGQIKLLGTLAQERVRTDARGIATFEYTVSHMGGNQSQPALEQVVARIPTGKQLSWDVEIGYDLVPVPTVTGGVRIYGAKGKHIHPDLAEFITDLGEAVAAEPSWSIPVTITAAALRWGGLYPPHFTHMMGGSFDFRPMSTDGQPTRAETDGSHAPNYDRARTLTLIRIFFGAGAQVVYFNDPEGWTYGAKPLAGHSNHLHVSWLGQQAQLSARLPESLRLADGEES